MRLLSTSDTDSQLGVMGSHLRKVALLAPVDKLDCDGLLDFFAQNGLAFYPGPGLQPVFINLLMQVFLR